MENPKVRDTNLNYPDYSNVFAYERFDKWMETKPLRNIFGPNTLLWFTPVFIKGKTHHRIYKAHIMQHKPHSPLSRKKTLERLKGRHEIRMRCRHGLPFGLRSVRLVSMGVPTESVLMWPSCEKTHMTAIISVRSFIKQTNKNSCDKITIFFHDA